MAADIPVYDKDPDSVELFSVNWAHRLGSATISSSSWTVASGITLVSDSETSTVATAKLSGGTAGTTYRCTNRVVTSAGETLDQSIDVHVTEK